MSKIAILLTDLFEDIEYTTPASAFDKAGHEIIHVGLKKGSVAKGKKNETPVKIDKSLNEVTIDDFDALFIPGGYSPDKLRSHDEAVDFVSEFVDSGKPVFTICHAPQLLISANAVNGRKITGWKSIIQDLKNAGATYLDKEVVVDNNLVSSRSPDDLTAFIDASLKKLGK